MSPTVGPDKHFQAADNPQMQFSSIDAVHMSQAIALAEQALFITSPNPRVGCVLVSADGQWLGQGHTQMAGGAHAEIMALRDAQERGVNVVGATAYVTLEPCSHQGRTGPCCDALIHAGIARVVASVQDPNPQVAGQGFAKLRAAGIQVDIGLQEERSRELNIGFFMRMQSSKPWLRMKIAQSLDGHTALNNGNSQWLTQTDARQDGHRWRARACAVLTGIGTVLDDDPLLNVRGIDTPRQPDLLLIDSQLQTPLTARLWNPARRVVIFHAQQHPDKAQALQGQGAHLVHLPGPGNKVDLPAMVTQLADMAYNEVHVEAGHKLNGSLLQTGLINELLVYVAPLLTGPGHSMAALPALHDLADAQTWRYVQTERIGADLRLLLRRIA
jgi:diaminohydroxyphosphoribosylaminopyrimidine deaminase/5-amino-6-(5-phosphoribosylamino)uracil reductase